jgi:hypothetical protein
VSWWNLDEASGTRVDAHGDNDLTDNNTVLSVINAPPAMDGAAASFVAANSESLSNASLVPSTASFTTAFWFFPNDVAGGYKGLLASDDGSHRNWSIINHTNFHAWIFPNAAGFATANAQTEDAWNLGIFWYDSGTAKCYLQLNGGTVAELAVTGGTLNATAAPLTVGLQQAAYFDGKMDEIAIWDRVLTADERAELFALGKGKFYDFS